MSIKNRIDNDLKTALLSHNKQQATTLRGLKGVILNAEIAEGARDSGLSDDKVAQLLSKEVKKLHDSIEIYKNAGEVERAILDEAEIKAISEYLPESMSDKELEDLVEAVMAQATNLTMANMGQIIGAVRAKAGPLADGARIASLVKERLSL